MPESKNFAQHNCDKMAVICFKTSTSVNKQQRHLMNVIVMMWTRKDGWKNVICVYRF